MATRDDTPRRISDHIVTVMSGIPLEHLESLLERTESLYVGRAYTDKAKRESAELVDLVERAVALARQQAPFRGTK